MPDFSSELPVRSQLPGQANYDDILVKVADGTAGASQLLGVDSSGRVTVKLNDGAGNALTSETNGAHQALDVFNQDLGSVAPGTAASYSGLIGGQYNTTLPTLTNGQQSAVQLDSRGRILTTASNFPVTVDTNYGTVGANTIRTASQIGNATGAADFNYGTVGAQTLRVAAQIGNATGAADFGAGATDAQTLRVAANQGAPNTVANAWPTLITNGTNTASVNASGQLSTTNTSLGSPSGGTAGTQSALAGGIYNSTPPTLTNGQQASLQLDAAGRLLVDAAVVFPYDENWGVVGATTLRAAAEIGNATGAADFNYGAVGAQTLRVAAELGNAAGAIDYNNGATDAQTIRVAANLAVGGANVSNTNPVPVSITSALVGTSINNYNTVASVAAGATSNHIYTITSGKTFNGKKIWASASGALKIEVRVSPDGSTYSSLWVGFNSTADPNITIDLDELVFLESGVGSTIEIIRTNVDKKSMDVYSTISGTEV